MAEDWHDYQEQAALFFRSLGLDAKTNVSMPGTRTSHDVDVLVKSKYVGFEVTWVVECKLWKTPISKLHVLALRQIVIDLGADRGILLSESGYQSGATEAATLTNVKLTSLAAFKESTKEEVISMRLREHFDRIDVYAQRYWAISKQDRIELGLRPEIGGGDIQYSATTVMSYCQELLNQAMRGRYPFLLDSLSAYDRKTQFAQPSDVDSAIEVSLSDLEKRLSDAEQRLKYAK